MIDVPSVFLMKYFLSIKRYYVWKHTKEKRVNKIKNEISYFEKLISIRKLSEEDLNLLTNYITN